jgi:multisubunit Na+/H+ antiporter MnhE subunit
VAGGLIYAGALLGMWIVLAGQPDIQDLVVGSVAAVLAVGTGYLVSDRGKMVPSARVADLRTLAGVPWQVVAETGQVFALAARKAVGRPVAPGALCTVPVDVGTDVRGWPAARREAVLTALMSAAPNTIVVDIDMEAGTALVHQLALIPCAWVCWRFGPEHRVVALGLGGTVQALAILCLAVGYREPGLASMAVVLAALSSGGSVAFARFLERWL